MKLLSKTEARSKKKLENDTLVDSNIRLRKSWEFINKKLNTIKDDYEPEKLLKLAEFERFCKEIDAKKQIVLREFASLQKLVEDTKETYYGFIEKQDGLAEIKYNIDEENKKLDLREAFILDLEAKWRNKQ